MSWLISMFLVVGNGVYDVDYLVLGVLEGGLIGNWVWVSGR
ncbi:hypothetical protein [Bacillus carboniphilus]